MSDEPMNENNPEATENPEPAAEAGDEPVDAEAAAEAERAAALEKELESVREENQKLLYACSEAQNAQRRAEEEGERRAKYAVASFAKDLLSVADNLRRGLESVSAEERQSNELADRMAEGMEMVERELLGALERHGVSRMETVGRRFDPHYHRAVFEVEDTTVPQQTVMQEVQPGYMIHDRLLREAMVGVSKGGPKPEPVPESDEGEEGAEAGETEAGGNVDTSA